MCLISINSLKPAIYSTNKQWIIKQHPSSGNPQYLCPQALAFCFVFFLFPPELLRCLPIKLYGAELKEGKKVNASQSTWRINVSFCRQWRSKTGSRKKRVRVLPSPPCHLYLLELSELWAGNILTTSSPCWSVLKPSFSHSGTSIPFILVATFPQHAQAMVCFCRRLSKSLCVIPMKDKCDSFV